MTYLTYAILLVTALAVHAFYTGSEMGLYTVNRFRLRRKQHAGERSAQLLSFLLHDPAGLLVTFLIGTNISAYAATALVTTLYEQLGLTPHAHRLLTAEVAATATLILPLFITEILTKDLVRRYAERISYLAAWGLAATKILLYPVVLLVRPIAALAPGRTGAHAGLGLPRLSKNILHHLLSAGRETGELTVQQERLARNVLRSGSRRVAALAQKIGVGLQERAPDENVPPATARTLTVTATELTETVVQTMAAARKRLALVVAVSAATDTATARLKSSDVLGYVRLFDLLDPAAQGRAVGTLVRPVPRLANHATLFGALAAMQRACADVAVVEETPPPPARRKAGPCAVPDAPTVADRPVLGVVRISHLLGELLGSLPPE